ncbi:unnamed protein product [Symbiodinium microadriaticum]|nr:unnamed protein product [Symbiodinium microadriaticum]CAE7897087.1 unnamed protein product [Symbiodinium sp. KB8]
MVSRIYPGGLFYVLPLDSTCHGIVKNQNVCFSLRPFSLSEIAGRDEKTVVEFLRDAVELCYAIGVRFVIHLPYKYGPVFMNGAMKETLNRFDFEKVAFNMKCFGAPASFQCMKFPKDSEKGFKEAEPSEISGTFGFAVVEVVVLRHRRNLLISNIPIILDDIAKKLADQDLDDWFKDLDEPAISLPKKKRRIPEDFIFEADEFFVTRPVAPLAPGPVAPGAPVAWLINYIIII